MVEDMGDVGFRISDAQAVAESVVAPLKKRVGAQAAFYEGVLKAAATEVPDRATVSQPRSRTSCPWMP